MDTNVVSKSSPLVSIIMAAHNVESYIGEAIESVLAQTYSHWELIVTDDASTDGTREIVLAYTKKDPRIKLIPLDTPVRQTIARIKAIEQSTGAYLAILDADDVCLPGRLATQVAFLEAHADVAVVGSAAEIIDENGAHKGRKQKEAEFEEIRFKLLLQTQFIHSAVCIRRSAYDDVGGYDGVTYGLYAEEYDLWNRFAQRDYRMANVPEVLVKYRIHPKSISINDHTGAQSERAYEVNEKNIRRYLPAVTRQQTELLSKLVNRPRLTVTEVFTALRLYRALTYAYADRHQLTGAARDSILRIYIDRRRHALRSLLKDMLRRG